MAAIIVALAVSIIFEPLDHTQKTKPLTIDQRLDNLENQTKVHDIVLQRLVNSTINQQAFDKQVISWANDTGHRIKALENKK